MNHACLDAVSKYGTFSFVADWAWAMSFRFNVYRENDITDIVFHTFAVEHRSFGQLTTYNLKENGSDQHVTEENKREYVKFVQYLNFTFLTVFARYYVIVFFIFYLNSSLTAKLKFV